MPRQGSECTRCVMTHCIGHWMCDARRYMRRSPILKYSKYILIALIVVIVAFMPLGNSEKKCGLFACRDKAERGCLCSCYGTVASRICDLLNAFLCLMKAFLDIFMNVGRRVSGKPVQGQGDGAAAAGAGAGPAGKAGAAGAAGGAGGAAAGGDKDKAGAKSIESDSVTLSSQCVVKECTPRFQKITPKIKKLEVKPKIIEESSDESETASLNDKCDGKCLKDIVEESDDEEEETHVDCTKKCKKPFFKWFCCKRKENDSVKCTRKCDKKPKEKEFDKCKKQCDVKPEKEFDKCKKQCDVKPEKEFDKCSRQCVESDDEDHDQCVSQCEEDEVDDIDECVQKCEKTWWSALL